MAAHQRGPLFVVVCALSILIGTGQFIGGLRLGFLGAPEELLRKTVERNRMLADLDERNRVSDNEILTDVNVTWPATTVRNDRQSDLARILGPCFMISAAIGLIGTVQLWRRKRAGRWLYLAGGLLYTAFLWWYEGITDFSGLFTIALQFSIALAFTVFFFLHARTHR